MLIDIIKKEILDNLLGSKFLLTFIISAALVLLSVYTGISGYLLDKREYEASVASVSENFQALEREKRQVSADLMRVYRPPQILKAIVSGVSDAAGRTSKPNNGQELNLSESKYGSNPGLTVFGALDLEFIVRIVLSLFALLFTYDAVSGEREKGTLRMALANNVSRAKLLLGKAIGGYISMMLPLVIPLLSGLVVFSLHPGIALTGGDWRRIGLLFLLFLLYLSAFFTLGLFVSSLTLRSSAGFLTLLFAWIVLVLIVPKVSAAAAGWIRPAPFAHETLAQKTRLIAQMQREADRSSLTNLYNDPVLRENPQKRLEEENKLLLEMGRKFEVELAAAYVKIDRDHWTRQEAQQRLAKNLSRVSPASGLTFGSMVLARTGVDEYNRFLDATRGYKAVYRDWIVRKNLWNEIGMNTAAPPGAYINISIAEMPQFQFEPESLDESLARTLPDFALMIAMTIIFLTGAFFAFLRYDVR